MTEIHKTPLLSDALSQDTTQVSFEFFPPKQDSNLASFFDTVDQLSALNPDFCSVTWGAGGSTTENSISVVSKINNEYKIPTIAHFTGLGMTQDIVLDFLHQFSNNGIRNVLALRGDIPHGKTREEVHAGGFRYASDMVSFIRKQPNYDKSNLSILVAGCPEGHPEAPSPEDDWNMLAHKVRQGADGIITQFFFDNDAFYKFKDALKGRGLDHIPVCIGIMVITKAKMIQKMVQMSGCSIPKKVQQAIDKYESDDRSMESFGIDYATMQIDQLLSNGCKKYHFYTLNRYNPTKNVMMNLSDKLVNARLK